MDFTENCTVIRQSDGAWGIGHGAWGMGHGDLVPLLGGSRPDSYRELSGRGGFSLKIKD